MTLEGTDDPVVNPLADTTKRLLEMLSKVKSISEVESQKMEYHKKYDYYKNLFYKEKTEKDNKINELKIYRDANQTIPEA